jgi:hypothetical protein
VEVVLAFSDGRLFHGWHTMQIIFDCLLLCVDISAYPAMVCTHFTTTTEANMTEAHTDSQHFAALKQSAYDKFISAPIGSDEYGVALTQYGHAVEDEYRTFFNLQPKWAAMSTETQKQDLDKVTSAYNAWMCFEAASVGYKFKEAAEARDHFDKLAREYKERYGTTWDRRAEVVRKPTTTKECEMFHGDGLDADGVRFLYGEEAERAYVNWLALNLK